eukprot:288928-Chlamydomonas_euryale.AAC.1
MYWGRHVPGQVFTARGGTWQGRVSWGGAWAGQVTCRRRWRMTDAAASGLAIPPFPPGHDDERCSKHATGAL